MNLSEPAKVLNSAVQDLSNILMLKPNSFIHPINLKLSASEVVPAAIDATRHLFSAFTLRSRRQLEAPLPGTARAERVLVGITADHEVVAPEGCRLAAPIDDRLVVIGGDRELRAVVDTEEEGARVLLTDCI